MVNTIICPNCKKPVEITQALTHQILEQKEEELNLKFQKELLEETEKVKRKTEEEAVKRITQELSLKLKDKENEAEETKQRNKNLQEQILDMSKMMRELKDKDESRELEMQKKLTNEQERIRLDVQKKVEEEQRFKILEKDKQLQDALKANEEMRRKLQQGSQQIQGEAFELEFEKLLHLQYPNDKIMPVGKGVKGGDIVHEVWDSRGNFAGKILWELKNTKTWQEGWVEKLKTDKRTINADEAVLISEVIPSDMKTAGFRDSIWVTQRGFVFPLADTFRAKLIQFYYLKNSVKGKDEKMEILYQYLSGNEFKHRVEAIVDSFSNMQKEIEKEKRYFSNKWARDEKNIRQVIDNTYGMHGDLKGIVGKVLPQIKGIDDDVPVLESGENEKK